jgi:hypothetical protein
LPPPQEGPSAIVQDYEVQIFFTDNDMNLVSDLRLGKFVNDTPGILTVAGDGYRVLSLQGKIMRLMRFDGIAAPDWADSGKVVDLNGDGIPEFAMHNNGGALLYDWEGHYIWGIHTGFWTHPFGADLDGQGQDQIIVAENAHGVTVYSPKGKRLRSLTSRYCSNLRVLNEHDGKSPKFAVQLMAHNPAGWDIEVLDKNGNRLQEWHPDFPFYEFGSVTQPPLNTGVLCFQRDNQFIIKDLTGKTVETLEAPNAKSLPIVISCVHGRDGEPTVVLASSRGSQHLFGVYVYGHDSKLIYSYQGRDNAESLLVLRDSQADGALSFLVGSRNKVLKFIAKPLR